MRAYEQYLKAFAVMKKGEREIVMDRRRRLRIFSDGHRAEEYVKNEDEEVVPVYILIEVDESGKRVKK